jgi:O-antigen ligase
MFWVKVFAWSFVLPVMYANLDLAYGGQFYADAGMRIKGSFSHPNVLSFYLCLGISYYFYLIKNKSLPLRRSETGAIIFLMVNMLVLLLATKTRNAWIACAVSFLIYGILRDRKTLLVLFLMMPLMLLVPSVKDRVVTAFNGQGAVDYEGVNSFEWRLNMWKSSLPMIAKRPIQGYGLTSFKEMSPMFSEDRVSMGAHNVYVEVLFESGIIGLLAFIWLFFNPFKFVWENMRKTKGQYQSVLWAIVVGYLFSYILICFADNLSYYLVLNWYVWFFIALMLISKRYMEPENKNSPATIN